MEVKKLFWFLFNNGVALQTLFSTALVTNEGEGVQIKKLRRWRNGA